MLCIISDDQCVIVTLIQLLMFFAGVGSCVLGRGFDLGSVSLYHCWITKSINSGQYNLSSVSLFEHFTVPMGYRHVI